MNPEKEGRLPIFIEPRDCVCDDITGAALDTVIAVFVRPVLLVESGVEVSKAAVEARRHVGLRIENERSDEGGSVIAGFLQDLWDRW